MRKRGMSQERASRLAGHVWYHEMSPHRKIEVLTEEKKLTPAVKREILHKEAKAARLFGHSRPHQRSSAMARGKRKRKVGWGRVIRSPRVRSHVSAHMPPDMISLDMGTTPKRRRKARKSVKRTRRAYRGGGKWHRPRVRRVKGRFFHAKHSRFFGRRKVMVNPRRRRRVRHNARRHRRFTYRRNPGIKGLISQLTNKQWLMSIVTIGGGLAAGMGTKTIMLNLMPMMKIDATKYGKFVGIGNIVVGSVLVAFMRQRIAKEIGVVIAATGAYDLFAQNVSALKLMPLPSWQLVAGIGAPKTAALSSSYPVNRLPISPVASMAASYPGATRAGYMGDSYLAPAARTQGFNGGMVDPYAGIFGD
jgi:hypothetical protein